MTLDQLRAAFRRTLRSYGVSVAPGFLEELLGIADHHAAEEAAAAVSDEAELPGVRA